MLFLTEKPQRLKIKYLIPQVLVIPMNSTDLKKSNFHAKTKQKQKVLQVKLK